MASTEYRLEVDIHHADLVRSLKPAAVQEVAHLPAKRTASGRVFTTDAMPDVEFIVGLTVSTAEWLIGLAVEMHLSKTPAKRAVLRRYDVDSGSITEMDLVNCSTEDLAEALKHF